MAKKRAHSKIWQGYSRSYAHTHVRPCVRAIEEQKLEPFKKEEDKRRESIHERPDGLTSSPLHNSPGEGKGGGVELPRQRAKQHEETREAPYFRRAQM